VDSSTTWTRAGLRRCRPDFWRDALRISERRAPQIVGTYLISDDTWDIAVDRTYAYLAGTDGLHILDVSDPTSPMPIGNVATSKRAQSVAVNGFRVSFNAGQGRSGLRNGIRSG
jgi:hypothetical protein